MITTPVAVVVMAKSPRPGMVKTRLEPLLGRIGCAELQALLLATVTGLTVRCGFRCYVAVSPGTATPEVAALVPAAVTVIAQRGADLGERMRAAVGEVFAAGAGRVLVVGTDAPTLSGATLAAASRALDRHDVVLGPAADGGYYLIGLSRPLPLFDLDPLLWGGAQVLDATLGIAAAAGLTVRLLPQERDLDTPDDATALATDQRLPRRIRDLLLASGGPAFASGQVPT